MPLWCDPTLEMARLTRECLTRIRAKHAAQQHGECFDDRRADDSPLRCEDRRT